MRFGFFEEQLQEVDCLVEMTVGEQVQSGRIRMPRVFAEQEMKNIIANASSSMQPIKVKFSRTAPTWSQDDREYFDREYILEFMNNSWMAVHQEDCEDEQL